jgi:hypothetical protein
MVDSEVASKDRLPPSPKHEKVQLQIQLARLCKLHPQSNQPNSSKSNLREHCPVVRAGANAKSNQSLRQQVIVEALPSIEEMSWQHNTSGCSLGSVLNSEWYTLCPYS